MDEAIVDEVIIPNLQKNYAIDSIIEDTYKKQILREAIKPFAEEIKIEMSFKDKINYISPLGSLPFEDENGEEPEIEVDLTELELEKVISPIFQKAIDITNGLLKRNNLKGSDLGALILVGGPTFSPILRRMLKEQITENIDTSVDPMTVVAKGAALFASTISVSDEVKEDTRDKTKLQLDIKYEATTVELDEMVNIKVLKEKTEGVFPEKIYVDVVRSDGAWSSGKKQVGVRSSIVEVLLKEGQSNSFAVNVYDEEGNKLECQPSQFSILQGIGGLEGMQVLPYHIGIAKYFHTEEKDLFFPVKGLEKNKKVPATGVVNGLRTRQTIVPGKSDEKNTLRIPIYQGEHNAEGTNPTLNNKIFEVIINGESLPKLLPEGSDVHIIIKVDKSQIMHFTAEFPTIEHTEDLKIEIKQTEPPTEELLAKEIAKAKRTAQRVNASDVSEQLGVLENQLENEKGSADGKMRILDGLRKELLKLDGAEKAAHYPQIEQELKDAFYELKDLIDKIKSNGVEENLNMRQIETHLTEFRKRVEHTIKDKNSKDAKELTIEILQLDFELRNAVTDNAMDVHHLRYLNDNFSSYHWRDANKAKQLFNQGLQMAADGNTSSIRNILHQLYNLMPENERPKDTLG